MATGSIAKRQGPRGSRWKLRVYAGIDPATGKDRRLTRTLPGSLPERDARRALRQMLLEVDRGQHAAGSRTVGLLLDRWYDARQAGWSPKDRHEHRRIIDLLKAEFGPMPLGKLKRDRIIGYYERLSGDGLAAGTVRRRHTVLRAALEYGLLLDWLVTNPAAGRGIAPAPGQGPPRAPSPAELAALLAAARRDGREGLDACLALKAHSGARRGEICALRWSDLDLDLGRAMLARAISVGDDGAVRHGMVEKQTKTERARRFTLGPRTVLLLRQHRQMMEGRAAAFGVRLPADGFVFSDEPDGSRPWRPDLVTKEFIRLRDQLGLRHVRLHDLRHYVATQLIGAGVDVRTVAGRLGHANASTTLNMYADFLPAADQSAAQLLERLLPDERDIADTSA